MTRLHGLVEKAWGSENILESNDKYCGKLLNFDAGGQFSMHFHAVKDETWYVLKGDFRVTLIDTHDASTREVFLSEGDVWRNEPLQPHQLYAITDGTIFEVSTPDSVEDNYRVLPGDSQKE